jgi:hypothetical protein
MKKILLTFASFALLGASAAHAQVCLTTSDDVKVCLDAPVSEPKCEAGYPAVTLVQQATKDQVTLAGTPVCVLRIEPGSAVPGDPFVVVKAKLAIATTNGSTQIETRDVTYYASQLSGATVSSALTLSK